MVRRAQHLRYYLKSIVRELRERSEGAENKLNNELSRSAIGNQKRGYSKNSCWFTTYRHRFARVAPLLEQIAPPRSSSKKLIEESWTRVARQKIVLVDARCPSKNILSGYWQAPACTPRAPSRTLPRFLIIRFE